MISGITFKNDLYSNQNQQLKAVFTPVSEEGQREFRKRDIQATGTSLLYAATSGAACYGILALAKVKNKIAIASGAAALTFFVVHFSKLLKVNQEIVEKYRLNDYKR